MSCIHTYLEMCWTNKDAFCLVLSTSLLLFVYMYRETTKDCFLSTNNAEGRIFSLRTSLIKSRIVNVVKFRFTRKQERTPVLFQNYVILSIYRESSRNREKYRKIFTLNWKAHPMASLSFAKHTHASVNCKFFSSLRTFPARTKFLRALRAHDVR